jgi:outer membrane biosynthesis protein TonB
MRAGRAIALLVLLAAIAGLASCKKKPPLPPQAQAPTITSSEPASQPAASTGAEAAPAQPEAAPKETTAAPAPPPKPKPVPRPRATAKPAVPKTEPPSRVVVPEGGAAPAASDEILASVPHDEALHQKWNSAQLLEATETNLRTLTRSLTADEQAMVRHIRSYMQQSRDATQAGDGERAYNLAVKAHLLSEELVKR